MIQEDKEKSKSFLNPKKNRKRIKMLKRPINSNLSNRQHETAFH